MNGETGVLVDFDRDRDRATWPPTTNGAIALPVDALSRSPRLRDARPQVPGRSAPAIVVVLDAAHR